MIAIQVMQCKPNPMGKNKTTSGVCKPEQLLAEWVDIKNIGNEAIAFSTIQLHHTLFDSKCQSTWQTETFWYGNGDNLLKPEEIVRVHTGKQQDQALMAAEDRGYPHRHEFAEKDNFVLNNICGDTIVVTWQDIQAHQYQDNASYAANPPQGAILKRSGNVLVSTATTSIY